LIYLSKIISLESIILNAIILGIIKIIKKKEKKINFINHTSKFIIIIIYENNYL
jgi:hypothetical protein